MMKKLIYLALPFSFSATALAFDDPAASLPKLDSLLGNMNFADAFRTGDRVELQRKSCTGTACGTMKAHYDVIRSGGGTADVTTTVDGNAQPHRVAKISRAQWDAINGNRARDVIREIESYGQRVTVTALRETSVTLFVNGRPQAAPAFELEFTSEGAIGGSSHHILTLSQLCRGPGQIALRISEDGVTGSQVTELLSCQLAP